MDEVHYPLGVGFVDNKLMARGLDPNEVFKAEDGQRILTSKAFIGAKADCLFSLIEAPSISEAGKSISLGDKELILRKVNALYNSIGEESVAIDKPTVHFGWRR